MNTTIRFGPSQIAILVLTLATAVIHFSRAAAAPEIAGLFALNGLGYLALAIALFLPALSNYRSWVRWIFIGYSAVTVLLYMVWGGMSGEWSVPLGPLDKAIEIGLIALLWREK